MQNKVADQTTLAETYLKPDSNIAPATGDANATVLTAEPAKNLQNSEQNNETLPTPTNQLKNYFLSPGDTLEITVWKEEGLQQQLYLVSPDGIIIFPLIGPIYAAGKTISDIKELITNKLSDFISDPSVTVKLVSNAGNTFFVIGKVNKPGQFSTIRRVDVLQALSIAGGLTVYADSGSLSVIRRKNNEVKVYPFDYDNVIKGQELEQNIMLEPGDTVTVP